MPRHQSRYDGGAQRIREIGELVGWGRGSWSGRGERRGCVGEEGSEDLGRDVGDLRVGVV